MRASLSRDRATWQADRGMYARWGSVGASVRETRHRPSTEGAGCPDGPRGAGALDRSADPTTYRGGSPRPASHGCEREAVRAASALQCRARSQQAVQRNGVGCTSGPRTRGRTEGIRRAERRRRGPLSTRGERSRSSPPVTLPDTQILSPRVPVRSVTRASGPTGSTPDVRGIHPRRAGDVAGRAGDPPQACGGRCRTCGGSTPGVRGTLPDVRGIHPRRAGDDAGRAGDPPQACGGRRRTCGGRRRTCGGRRRACGASTPGVRGSTPRRRGNDNPPPRGRRGPLVATWTTRTESSGGVNGRIRPRSGRLGESQGRVAPVQDAGRTPYAERRARRSDRPHFPIATEVHRLVG